MKKILVVDNHLVFLKFMTNLLEKNGFHVLSASGGLKAIDILKNYIPDIIFLDLVMPSIGGRKLCRIIRNMPSMIDVKIVIISGIASDERIDFKTIGADACIAKGPFNEVSEHVLSLLGSLDESQRKALTNKVLGSDRFDLKEISKELLSSREHYINILDNLSEGILELTYDERIVYANTAALHLTGITEEELLSLNFTELFSTFHCKKIGFYLNKAKRAENQVLENGMEVTLNNHDVIVNIFSLKQQSKNLIVVLTDITEKKLAEDQLRQAQKTEAISTLSGGVAHDFNNLLMGIQGNVSLMLLDLSPEQPEYKRLKNIEAQVENGTKLTKCLLSYAKYRKTEVKTTDFNSIIQIQNQIIGQLKKEITIKEDLEKNIWPVDIDRGEMERVVLNVYINAGHAMNGCGTLFIKTENVVPDKTFLKSYSLDPGKFVKITIADNGPGIDEDIQEKIFDPFFTTKELGQGTGLGLSSAYGIIKSHNGIIKVESRKGEGAAFVIYLPASFKQIEQEVEHSEEFIKASETILLVDDEDMVLDIGKEMLERIGHRVLIARCGEDAVNIIKKTYETDKKCGFIEKESDSDLIKPDLVILDMIMPDMDGGTTFDTIKSINPEVKVLLSSGYSQEGKAAGILKRGCEGFIQKPFKIDKLSREVRNVLAL